MEQLREEQKRLLCNACGLDLRDCLCSSKILEAARDPWIGQKVSEQYEITELIARGGMGTVYKAKHLHLGSFRAIKMIRSDIKVDEVVFQRFKQEAQAVSGLSHKNIVSFYDYGISEGTPYAVMDLLKGEALSDLISRKGRLSVAESLEIFEQVAGAVAHAHSKGIFHRDLKPSNIMLAELENGETAVKIMDFGIAKIQSDNDAHKLTSTGEIFGSPAYMSPEQARGSPIDARSDIYSLGTVMFEAINGNPPFIGANPLETLMKHQNERVPALFFESDKSFDPVSKDMEAIILRCLEKDPAARYASMSALEEDLKKLRYGERLLYLQHEMSRRKRFQLLSKIYKYALISFAIAILPYAIVVVFFNSDSLRDKLSAALDDPENADKAIQQIIADLDRSESSYLRNLALLHLEQAQILRLKASGHHDLYPKAIEKYKQAILELDRFSKARETSPSGITHALRSESYRGLALSYLQNPHEDKTKAALGLEAARKSVDLRRKSVEYNGKLVRDNALPLAETLLTLARAKHRNGDNKAALASLAEAEKLFRDFAPFSWQLANCLLVEGRLMETLGERDGALAKFEEAQKIAVTIYEPNDHELAVMNNAVLSLKAKMRSQ